MKSLLHLAGKPEKLNKLKKLLVSRPFQAVAQTKIPLKSLLRLTLNILDQAKRGLGNSLFFLDPHCTAHYPANRQRV